MISVDDAIRMHHTLIDEFGGSKGVRDLRGLEAVLARPFGTFD
jgi:death-on-curing protein